MALGMPTDGITLLARDAQDRFAPVAIHRRPVAAVLALTYSVDYAKPFIIKINDLGRRRSERWSKIIPGSFA